MSDEDEYQKHLSLTWKTRDHWPDLRKEFGVKQTGAAMILSLVMAGDWITYSRHKDHYATPRRYRNPLYTYRRVVGQADYLDSRGLIFHRKSLPGQRGWQSEMRATPELIKKTNQIIQAGPSLVMAKPREVIVLRDADKMAIDYRETNFTCKTRNEIEQINESLSTIRVEGGFITSLRRIFNRNFNRGGRMYAQEGAWQTMSKLSRRQMKIGGEPVVEIDCKTLHPALLYAEVGMYRDADAYLIEGWPRPLTKLALNVLINAPTYQGTVTLIAHSEQMGEIAEPGSEEAMQAARKVIADIKQVHAPIARFFHSGKGIELQRLDSDMAVKIMVLLNWAGIEVLTIHDSFLVPASKADLAEDLMREVACEIGLDRLKFDRHCA